MVQQHTLSHTVVLEVSAGDIWEVSKQLDEILPALEPEYFTKSTFIEGIAGEPGSIRLIKPGPGITTRVPSGLEFLNLVLPNSNPQPTLEPNTRSSKSVFVFVFVLGLAW
jgi:hypothetical protein